MSLFRCPRTAESPRLGSGWRQTIAVRKDIGTQTLVKRAPDRAVGRKTVERKKVPARNPKARRGDRHESMTAPVAPREITADLREQVRALNRRAVAPRQIARSTGLAPAQVLDVLREILEAEYHGPQARAITGCWVNAGWSSGLRVPDEYQAMDRDVPDGFGGEGLVIVVVARREPQGMLRVCQYLLDVFCLGVKNTIGPLVIAPEQLDGLLADFYQSYPDGYLEIPEHLAVELVWGACDYAGTLGFSPAAGSDWADTRGHLGERPPEVSVRFGREGRPFYVNGPYDNADRVLATLRRTVGDAGFETVLRFG
jgi:hypothetical protein